MYMKNSWAKQSWYCSTSEFNTHFCNYLISVVEHVAIILHFVVFVVHDNKICKVDRSGEHVAEKLCEVNYYLIYCFVCNIHV